MFKPKYIDNRYGKKDVPSVSINPDDYKESDLLTKQELENACTLFKNINSLTSNYSFNVVMHTLNMMLLHTGFCMTAERMQNGATLEEFEERCRAITEAMIEYLSQTMEKMQAARMKQFFEENIKPKN